MRAHLLTDRLFDGTTLHTGRSLRLTTDGNRIAYVGDHAAGPVVAAGEQVADLRGRCLPLHDTRGQEDRRHDVR
jgi:hypothetical protein